MFHLQMRIWAQVTSISFFEHHVMEGATGGSGWNGTAAGQKLQRRCVMEAEVTNRTDGSLQVITYTLPH